MIKELFVYQYGLVQMCLGTDGTVLFSCSEDSNICVWEVKNIAKKTSEIDKPSVYTDDIIINWSRYDKLHENIKKNEIAVKKIETESTINLNKMMKIKEQNIKEILSSDLKRYYEAIQKKKVISKLLYLWLFNINNI